MEQATANIITVPKITDPSRYLSQVDRDDIDGDFYNDITKNRDEIHAICCGNETVGLASVCDDPDAYLYIYIFPDCRNRGYGTQALRAATDLLRSSPLQSISTAYDSQNAIAAHFARSQGFETRFFSSLMTYRGNKFEIPELPIRKLQEEFFEEAFHISAEAFHIMRLETGHDPNSVLHVPDAETRKSCLETADERYVYQMDGEIVGCAHIDGAELDIVAIKISRQGQGFGRLFVKYLVNEILEKDVGQPFLYCLVSNRKAWKLYESLGFEETFRMKFATKKIEPPDPGRDF